MKNPARRVFSFYVDGFRGMTLGRVLWALVIVKLVVLLVLLWTLFPDVLETRFGDEASRADHVLERLSRPGPAAKGR